MRTGSTAPRPRPAVAGSAGAISVGLNSAVADNNTRNIARILGGTDAASRSTYSTGALKIGAYGRATANAQVWGRQRGAVSVLGSAAVALLRSRQEAQVQGGNITAASLDAVSSLNKNLDNMDYVDASSVPGAGNIKEGELDSDSRKAAAFAGLISGNGAAIGVTANPATATQDAVSMAKIAPKSLMLQGSSLSVKSEGTANVLSQSLNQDLAAIMATVMVNLAYSQSQFIAQVDLPQGSSAQAGDVNVSADYTANAEAVVAPSAGGAKVSAGSIQVNLAIADADSIGTAAISGSGGKLKANARKVLSRGTALSNAYNITPIVSVSGAEIIAMSPSNLDASNEAYIQGVDMSDASIDVQAQLNNTANTRATATLGNSYKATSGVSVSFISVEANVAKARNNSRNHAYMKDVTVDMGKAASVLAQGWSYAKASVQEEDVNLYGLSVGVNVVNARADGDFRSYVEGRSGGEINVRSLSVRRSDHSLADALSRQPSLGIGAVEVDTNVAYANAGTVALSYIGGSGKVNSAGERPGGSSGRCPGQGPYRSHGGEPERGGSCGECGQGHSQRRAPGIYRRRPECIPDPERHFRQLRERQRQCEFPLQCGWERQQYHRRKCSGRQQLPEFRQCLRQYKHSRRRRLHRRGGDGRPGCGPYTHQGRYKGGLAAGHQALGLQRSPGRRYSPT
ncbi:MAG: hypothetical protein V8T45_07270 [Oscillospiraceae bacterium]